MCQKAWLSTYAGSMKGQKVTQADLHTRTKIDASTDSRTHTYTHADS